MPEDNPKAPKAPKKKSVESTRDASKGATTGIDLTEKINYNQDPTKINPKAKVGAWNAYSKFLASQKIDGQAFKNNPALNTPEGMAAYTNKSIEDFNNSDYVKKFPDNRIDKDQIRYAQEYHKLSDPRVQVDGWNGSQTSTLFYPTPQAMYQSATGSTMPSDTSGFVPVTYGNKDYVIRASKIGGGASLNDYVPYDPALHSATLQRGNFKNDPNRFQPIQSRAKGGLIQKLAVGGNINYNEFGSANGVIGQNDPYAAQKQENESWIDSETGKETTANGVKFDKGAKAIGNALGGVGTAYYNSTPAENKSEAVRNSAFASISSAGPIGGAIGGSAAIGDKIGKPIKTKSEKLDASGNLVNPNKSRQNAIGGALFSPSKALAYRSESGNWGDVTGKKYNEYLEKGAKEQIQELKDINQRFQQDQAVANRDNFGATKLENPYDLSKVSFDENRKLVYPQQPLNKGGLVGKIKQMCADGGNVKKDKIPKLKPRDFKAEKANYEMQTRGANEMDGSGISAAEMAYRASKLADPTFVSNLAEVAKDAYLGNKQNPLNIAGAIPIPYLKGASKLAKSVRKYYMLDKAGDVLNKAQDVASLADGGVIKGKGTGKSDSINAKVKGDSFVVPAENAEAAEEIREKILGKSPRPIANLKQKGGEQVKLSNGEHLFTPEEKEELMEKGVNVDMLAPKSEVKAMDKGHVMFPKVLGYKDGGNIPKGTKVNGATWNGKNWVSDTGSIYTSKKGKSFESAYNQSVEKAKGLQKQKTDTELNVYKRKLKEANDSGNSGEASKLQAKINQLSGVKTEVDSNTKKDEAPSQKTAPKAPSVKSKSTASKSSYTPPSADYNPNDEVVVPNGNISGVELKKQQEKEALDNENAKSLNDTAYAADYKNNPLAPKPKTQKTNGILNKIGNVDPTAFVGIGQTALGLNQLSKSKRPVWNPALDQTYNNAVDRSIKDASFGLTPENKYLLEQDNQNAMNDARASARNYAGGSGTTAFNQERAAINQGLAAKLGLKIADQDKRMEKQMYADQQIANRANILANNRRTAFNDAMGAFQQKQQAGSELIGAGLANTIGAYRFNKDMQARQAADQARTDWTSRIGYENM